jgi:hypothetical protein
MAKIGAGTARLDAAQFPQSAKKARRFLSGLLFFDA